MSAKPAQALPIEPPLLGEDSSAAERRHEPRLPGRLEVRFSLASQAARALRAYSLNFSMGGLCLKPHGAYPVGTELRLTLQIQDQGFELDAVVAWVREGAIGVRFIQVDEPARERLQALIDDGGGR